MDKVNGYRNFIFGDIIKFTDENIDKRLKNKEFKFIKVDDDRKYSDDGYEKWEVYLKRRVKEVIKPLKKIIKNL